MSSYSDPSKYQVAVTPSDSVDINGGQYTRGLYIGTTGDVVVVSGNNTAVTFVGVPAGAVLPVRVTRVNSTNTTASNIVALF